MITIEKAKAIVRKNLEKKWKGRDAFVIGDVYQDSKSYAVGYGNKAFIVGKDTSFMIPDAPIAVVDKANGRFELVMYTTNQKRFDSMKLVN